MGRQRALQDGYRSVIQFKNTGHGSHGFMFTLYDFKRRIFETFCFGLPCISLDYFYDLIEIPFSIEG